MQSHQDRNAKAREYYYRLTPEQRIRRAELKRVWYANNSEFKARKLEYERRRVANLSPEQKAARTESSRLHMSRYRSERRKEAIDHYGGKCACCSEIHLEFLTIDHIEGGGVQHRKTLRSGTEIYFWLKRNNYPDNFRVLCANCNHSYGAYKYCPHKKEQTA